MPGLGLSAFRIFINELDLHVSEVQVSLHWWPLKNIPGGTCPNSEAMASFLPSSECGPASNCYSTQNTAESIWVECLHVRSPEFHPQRCGVHTHL